MLNDYQMVNWDTDALTFCKKNEAPFSLEEQEQLLKELNSLFPKEVQFEHNGYYKRIICIRAKNYVLWDGEELIVKGSALRSPTLELALREFITSIIWTIIKEEYKYLEIYNNYVKEIDHITDIKRWACRRTITNKTLTNERTNEKKIRDAIEDSEYVEGNRIWVYFRSDNELELVENFTGDYNKDKLYKKLHQTALRFSTIIDKNMFLNYSLKRNKEKLQEFINEV